MQRLIRLAREVAINFHEVLRARNFAADDDLIFAQAVFQSEFGGLERGEHHALVDDFFGGEAEVFVGVLLHFAHHEFLIQRAAVHADADGLAVVARHFADGGELFVAALAGADVAGIDAVFIERGGAVGILGEQDMAVVMEVTDEGDVAALVEQALFDFRTAAAASGMLTVMRTISEPACASSRHCWVVDSMFTVSVLVMDCTTTGAPPPTWILPTLTPTVLCRLRVITFYSS